MRLPEAKRILKTHVCEKEQNYKKIKNWRSLAVGFKMWRKLCWQSPRKKNRNFNMKTFQTKAHHLEVNNNYASWQNYIKMSSVMETKQSRSNAFILRNVLCARLARIILQNLPHKNCARHFSYFFAYLLNEKKKSVIGAIMLSS